jgi:hypothetical protein
MTAIGIMARGRAAWIGAIILGVILGVIGALTGPSIFFIVAGGAFFLFGLVMLILSYVTGGASD